MMFYLTFFLLFLSFIYVKRRYFTLQGPVPGIPPQFLVGNLWQTGVLTGRQSLKDAWFQMQKQYGNVFQYWIGPLHFYVFCGVDDAVHIFNNGRKYDILEINRLSSTAMFDDGLSVVSGIEHKRQRRLLSSLFSVQNAWANADSFITNVDQLIELWRQEELQQNVEVHSNLFEQLLCLSVDLAGLVICGRDLKTLTQNNRFAVACYTLGTTITRVYFKYFPLFFTRIYIKLYREYQRAYNIMKQFASDLIKETNLNNVDNGKRNFSSIRKSRYHGDTAGMTEEVKIGNVSTIMAASTSMLLILWAYIFYTRKYPHVQKKIKEELSFNGINKQTKLTQELINNLTYIDSVMKEIFRMVSTGNGLHRTVLEDDMVNGVLLKKGDNIIINFNAIHRDPTLWKIDPELFEPERFLTADKNHHSRAILQFGGGDRGCPAAVMARINVKLFIIRTMLFLTFEDLSTVGNTANSDLFSSPMQTGIHFE